MYMYMTAHDLTSLHFFHESRRENAPSARHIPKIGHGFTISVILNESHDDYIYSKGFVKTSRTPQSAWDEFFCGEILSQKISGGIITSTIVHCRN